MSLDMRALGARIQALDFDHVFTLSPDGTIGRPGRDLFAPSVFHDEELDVWIDGPGWEALAGMTGQYAYHGAVMHPSEYIGGNVAARMLDYVDDAPEAFTITSVEVMPEDHADVTGDECPACGEDPADLSECYPEPAGWAILHYVG